MRTNHLLMALCLINILAHSTLAMEHATHSDMAAEHGGGIFHMFRLEIDVGSNSDGKSIQNWDLDGWIGTDENKLWLKSEGERADSKLESTQLWGLYSRNIATFWDAQIGLRHDTEPESTTYLTFGVNGLAPYFFETESHIFVSERGNVTARLRQESDLLLTQKWILQPYFEVNLSAQNVQKQDIGAGVTDAQIGLQTRYEFIRKFAPYIDIHYGRKIGKTSSLTKKHGKDNDELVGTIGLRLMF